MSDEQTQKLLQGAVRAARAGEKDLARRAFLQILKTQPRSEQAWLGLATVARDRKEKLLALRRLLTINPHSEKGLEALRRLGLEPEQLFADAEEPPAEPDGTSTAPADTAPPPVPEPQPEPEPEPELEPEPVELPDYLRGLEFPEDEDEDADETDGTGTDIADRPEFAPYAEGEAVAVDASLAELFARWNPPPQGSGGVPLPEQAALESAAARAAEITETYREQYQAPLEEVLWTRKKRRRAGEHESLILNLQIAAGTLLALIVIGGIGTAIALNNPNVRSVVFAPTWTISPTPTFTPTSTPGVTPTPSSTPEITHTPSPTVPPTVTPGDPRPDNPPEPTDIYLPPGISRDAEIEQAAELIEQRDYEPAYELLQRVREATAQTGNFTPYYFLSLWHLRQGDVEGARRVIAEGDELRQERARSDENYIPLVNVASARVDLYEAQQRIAQEESAADLLTQVESLTEEAIQLDGRFIDAYVLRARAMVLNGEHEAALQMLEETLNSGITAEIYTDTRLRMEQARIYMELEDYDSALQELYEVLYINPFLEEALRMQIEAALASGKPGLAVIYSEQYLFYYPNSVEGYRYLGIAHAAEGKTDLALDDFSHALQGDPDAPGYVEVLRARADIYRSQGRYDLALADLNEALELVDDPALRLDRMYIAYQNGSYDIAQTDAERLRETDLLPEGELLLLGARIRIDQADAGDTGVYQQALADLERAVNVLGIPSEQRPIADEYLARAYYHLERYNEALSAVDRALNEAETGSRRYLRGLILEAQGETEAALREYEFVLSWSTIFQYPFTAEAERRYNALLARAEDEEA